MFEGFSDEQLREMFDELEIRSDERHRLAVETANSGIPDAMRYYRQYDAEAQDLRNQAGQIVLEMRRRGHKLFPNGE